MRLRPGGAPSCREMAPQSIPSAAISSAIQSESGSAPSRLSTRPVRGRGAARDRSRCRACRRPARAGMAMDRRRPDKARPAARRWTGYASCELQGRNQGAVVEGGDKAVDHQTFHGPARVHRARCDVRGQNDVLHPQQGGGRLWLVLEDIERGGAELARPQRLYQAASSTTDRRATSTSRPLGPSAARTGPSTSLALPARRRRRSPRSRRRAPDRPMWRKPTSLSGAAAKSV